MDGRLRVTVQGETIEAAFGLPDIAIESFELYANATLEATLLDLRHRLDISTVLVTHDLAQARRMADWVVRVLDNAKISKASFVGHSMGTLISLDCAARYPQRVERIALIATAYPMKVGEPFLDAAKRNSYDAFDMSTIWGHAPQVPLGGNPNPGMWMYGDTQARLERLAPGVLHADLKACNDFAFAGDVKCPVLIILDKRDVMTPLRGAKGLQEKLPAAKTVVIDFSAHSLMAEAPDATLDALIDFLK